MLKYHVKMDFCDDYSRLVRCWMNNQKIKSDKNGWDLWYEYFNFQKKNVVAVKRKVLKSKEFGCPLGYEQGLEGLVQKFERGEDVSMYLSKKAKEPSLFDDLLYDWGIYHFHLGDKIDRKTGYIERTGPLLFAMIDSKNVYFINVYEHGSWTKQEMIRIVHENWPETIKRFRIQEAWSITPEFTDSEYVEVRKNHMSALIEIEKGVVYWGPGGGYTSSGHSIEIVSLCDRIHNSLKSFEAEIITKRFHDVIRYIERYSGKIEGNRLYFMLWEIKNDIYILEFFSGVVLARLEF